MQKVLSEFGKKKPHCNVFYEKKGKKITCRLGPYHIEIVGSLSLITAVTHIFLNIYRLSVYMYVKSILIALQLYMKSFYCQYF